MRKTLQQRAAEIAAQRTQLKDQEASAHEDAVAISKNFKEELASVFSVNCLITVRNKTSVEINRGTDNVTILCRGFNEYLVSGQKGGTFFPPETYDEDGMLETVLKLLIEK